MFKNLFRAPRVNVASCAQALTVPPMPSAKPDTGKREVIIPQRPTREESRADPPRTTMGASQKPLLGLGGDNARRLTIALTCSKYDLPFGAHFRQNSISKQWYFLSTSLPADGDSSRGDSGSYRLSELNGFSRAVCAHCGASAWPICCNLCKRFLCRAGLNERYFTCPCGNEGWVEGGLGAVHGSESACVQRRGLPPGRSTAAQLTAPASPVLLLPGTRR
jgi:hypothetical protein